MLLVILQSNIHQVKFNYIETFNYIEYPKGLKYNKQFNIYYLKKYNYVLDEKFQANIIFYVLIIQHKVSIMVQF